MQPWPVEPDRRSRSIPDLFHLAPSHTGWPVDQLLIDISADKARRRRRVVLLVDDNPDARLLLGCLLEDTYEVIAASGVDEAMALARGRVFDAFVLDINLREQRSGVDLLRTLRQLSHCREIPAVAYTAYAGWRDRARLLAAGFDWYVAKPFTLTQLHYVLDQIFLAQDG